MKKFNSDKIFEFALFTLPFENFFFAPSAGWATISPLIMFMYIILNIKNINKPFSQYIKVVFFFLAGMILTSLNWIIFSTNLNNFVGAIESIFLGITILFSITIYVEKNKININDKLKKIISILIVSYSISILFGIIQFFIVKYNISSGYNFFSYIFKRNYLRVNRVQFFFTEPSFIGMHLFGILLPLYFVTNDKKLLYLIIIYSCFSILFSSGVRIILDIFFVLLLLLFSNLIKKKLYILVIFLPLIGISLFSWAINNNYRIHEIYTKGVYADGSLASRYFRIKSSVLGYSKKPLNTLIGFGIGNEIIPLRLGYDEALADYKSWYMREIYELGDHTFTSDSVSYCLFIRIISEYGIVLFFFFIIYLINLAKQSSFKYKWPYLIILLYIYLQFESFAFYSLWLYIVIMTYYRKKEIHE